ncbi:lipid A 4'-phosphatase [Rhizobium sp. SG_E_25_P2]|uniref:phosphatase PAP2 family protein n=1 Tax=Rhizobium sp. SG_E_25_P2 TaxID=2879942 RepID=UPI002476762D|nr:phosphatase PAP2 family protein [Rhizobium sp. SG_E_25_P2]MDH6266796.1 lipid A 4'-phosphatase [Rhizobium sp. SG_E_25_P2]
MMIIAEYERMALPYTLLAMVASTVTLGVFQAFPGLDLATAKLFCHAYAVGDLAAQGRYCPGFPAQVDLRVMAIRKILFFLPPLVVAFLALDMIYRWAITPPWLCRGFRLEALAIIAYLVVPIGVVNGIFKEYSGRPRPYETHLFGGDLNFASVADFSGACTGNCSFISGEAAAAGWLLGVAVILQARRPVLSRILIAAAAVTPVLRVAMGGHYLSDALLGWLAGAVSLPLMMLCAAPLKGALMQVIKSRT